MPGNHRDHRGHRVGIWPMPPMVPMLIYLVGGNQCIGRCTPPARRPLPRQHPPRHARARKFLKLRRNELTGTPLGIHHPAYVFIQVTDGHGLIIVTFPPESEQLGDHLPLRIAFLRLTNQFRRIATPKRQQRISNPTAPLLEASRRTSLLQVPAQAAPPPYSQSCGQKFHALCQVNRINSEISVNCRRLL